ncbi:hypothetical protein PP654_gp011 [Bacillus phage v_B-Bak10]|uniref:Uncharacterized protein n=1 Tax=Bacillus phage v_B-Bak10 TaxID=2094736 RepID=A0A385IK90_9CAUD|nr:hypothetical protein PP654_gp011 [Bacillus phage v_B-Bak10]AXY83280.1 hypothetical protein vBBBak10_011 [Bacillus phage v_B-Bak10]
MRKISCKRNYINLGGYLMEGIILKCPKGYIKKLSSHYTVVSTEEEATLFFTESFVDELIDYLTKMLNVNISSFEKLKAERITTIIK